MFEKRQLEGLARFADGHGVADGVKKRVFRKFTSYVREDQLPSAERTMRNAIFVDKHSLSVIFPINGQAVPFHLNTLKNVTKVDDGDCMMLRFNFVAPGQTGVRKEDVVSIFVYFIEHKRYSMTPTLLS